MTGDASCIRFGSRAGARPGGHWRRCVTAAMVHPRHLRAPPRRPDVRPSCSRTSTVCASPTTCALVTNERSPKPRSARCPCRHGGEMRATDGSTRPTTSCSPSAVGAAGVGATSGRRRLGGNRRRGSERRRWRDLGIGRWRAALAGDRHVQIDARIDGRDLRSWRAGGGRLARTSAPRRPGRVEFDTSCVSCLPGRSGAARPGAGSRTGSSDRSELVCARDEALEAPK